MGIVFSGMFGLGIVLYTKIETDVHLDHILFGDMLGVGWRDVVETGVIAAVGHRRHRVCSGRDLLLHAFDPAARAGDRPAGQAAALRPAGDPVADHRRRAEGGRHHPRRSPC